MAEVIGIRGTMTDAKVQEDTVARLENLLLDARAGQLRGFAYALQNADGSTRTGWTGGCDGHKILAAATALKHRLTNWFLED